MPSRFWSTRNPYPNGVAHEFAPCVAPYLGQVATRAAVPTATVAQTKMMSRVAMYATEALVSYQLKFGAWIVLAAGNEATTGIGSAVTYTASIEYPAGTFTQIKWGGVASVTAAVGGDTGLCDPITTAIPQGAKFFVRVYATTTASGVPVSDQNSWNAGGDACVIDGTATDLTMSGTVTGANTQGIFPLCVVQMTSQPTFMIVGDSRSGALVGQQDSNGNVGQFAYGIGTSTGYINTARGSARAFQFVTGGARRAALSQYVTHVLNGLGINDITTASATLPMMQTSFQAMAYLMPGKRHVIATLSPDTSSTDSWATLANQTLNANSAVIDAFNTWARSLPDPYYYCIDIASITESGTTGKWVAGYTSDGLHQNATSIAAIAASGVVNVLAIGGNLASSYLRWSPYEYGPLDWYDAADNNHNGTTNLLPVYGGTITNNTAAYGATSFNGGPGYSFTTSAQYWYFSGDTVSQSATGIMLGVLWSPSAYPAANTAICGYTVTTNSTPRAMIMMDTSGHPGLAIRRNDADTTVTAYGSTALTIGSPYLLVAQFDVANGVAYLYVNGVLACTANYATSGSTSSTVTFQTLFSFLGGKGAYGVFGEMIGFNIASASNAVRQQLEGSIAWRRGGASVYLPTTHPYYSQRPTP